jgi:hypothetical protein
MSAEDDEHVLHSALSNPVEHRFEEKALLR